MGKIKLSVTVIISFIIYSFIARKTGLGSPVLSIPKNLSQPLSKNTLSNKSSIGISSTPTATPTQTTTTPTPSASPTSNYSSTVSNPTPIPTPTPSPTNTSKYKDGVYTGSTADAFYGYIQVQVTISSGKISHVKFLQYPNTHSTSVYINSQADPMLAQEAIQTQSANVDIISGATDTSIAFNQSMQSALNQALN